MDFVFYDVILVFLLWCSFLILCWVWQEHKAIPFAFYGFILAVAATLAL
jgi:hypothetical protein